MLIQAIITFGFFAAVIFAIQVKVPIRDRHPIV